MTGVGAPQVSESRWRARVLTISDGVMAGTREDRGGPAVAAALQTWGALVEWCRVTSDGDDAVEGALRDACDGFSGLVVTTGGTGFGPRDLTPEGTRRVVEREAPGLAEAMRSVNPLGRLTRGVAGTSGQCLVLNLPGSPAGAVECLEAVIDVVPHVLQLLRGETGH